MKEGIFGHVRSRLVRGVFLILPLVITVWLVRILFDIVDGNLTPVVRGVLEWLGIPGLERWFAKLGIPVIGLLLTAIVLYLIGLLASNLATRRLVVMAERAILRIPLVKGIYGASRQLLDAFGASSSRGFRRVVMLEYPRRGVWTLGFVTNEVEHRIGAADVGGSVPVFLPTTPNPTSGWMVLVPTRDLMVVDLTVEEGIKLIVSGGIVSPRDLGPLLRRWPERSAPPAD